MRRRDFLFIYLFLLTNHKPKREIEGRRGKEKVKKGYGKKLCYAFLTWRTSMITLRGRDPTEYDLLESCKVCPEMLTFLPDQGMTPSPNPPYS